MTHRSAISMIFNLLLLAISGCAPADFVDGVTWTVRQSGTSNAAFQIVDGYPSLRVNAFLLDRLDQVRSTENLSRARMEMHAIVRESYELARYAINNEIDRLPLLELSNLWKRYNEDEVIPHNLRERLRSRFWTQVEKQHATLESKIQSAQSIEDVHTLADLVRSATKRSVKARLGSILLLKLVASSIKEDREPLDRGGPLVDVYEPTSEIMCMGNRSVIGVHEDELLSTFAPIIVQERNTDAIYDNHIDQIGTVQLSGQPENYRVGVNTKEPSVYAYWQYTWINNRRHLQLTYTHWFPEHPSLKPFDPEAGDIEGATLRITLDSDNKPAIFETVLNCGCYHRCYPAIHIEKAACDSHGGPLPDKHFCIERVIDGKMDWIVPGTIDVVGGNLVRPILFSRAGYHGLAGISFDKEEIRKRNVREKRDYTLRCYDDLERLPIGNGFASMFGSDGLVRGAARLEGTLLMFTGMLSAGQPRQRGTQLLHWDQYDFDDPHLLEKCLRLPMEF